MHGLEFDLERVDIYFLNNNIEELPFRNRLLWIKVV